MVFQTVSFGREASEAERRDVEAAAQAAGGTVAWRTSARVRRTYGLLALPPEKTLERAIGGATLHQTAIIALAVFPAVAEALPHLAGALGGPGKPSGVIACTMCPGGMVVEWEPGRTAAGTIVGLIDVELRRFGSARTAELLAPLPPAIVAQIASEGLASPEITQERELETLLERAGLRDA